MCIRDRLGIGVALLVRAYGEQLAAFQVDARGHAALIDVVHHLAVADAQKGIYDPLLFICLLYTSRCV